MLLPLAASASLVVAVLRPIVPAIVATTAILLALTRANTLTRVTTTAEHTGSLLIGGLELVSGLGTLDAADRQWRKGGREEGREDDSDASRVRKTWCAPTIRRVNNTSGASPRLLSIEDSPWGWMSFASPTAWTGTLCCKGCWGHVSACGRDASRWMDDLPHVASIVVTSTDVGEASSLLIRRVLVVGGSASSPGRIGPGVRWITLMGSGVRIHVRLRKWSAPSVQRKRRHTASRGRMVAHPPTRRGAT